MVEEASPPPPQPDIFRRLWNASFTSVRLDVHRPTLAAVAARTKRPRRRTLFRSREESDERRTLRIGPFDVSSATAGLMQMWELGPDVRVAPGKRARRACDFGFGAVFAADENAVQPVMRVRCRVPYWLPFAPDAVLRLLPEPEAVLKGSWPVPLTGLRVGARLSLPFGAEQFDAVQLNARIPWRPHFSCKLYSSADRGPVQFSPRGLELAEQSVSIGRDTVLRLAATVDYPREWPRPDDEPPIQLRIDKLSLKTRVRYGNAAAMASAAAKA